MLENIFGERTNIVPLYITDNLEEIDQINNNRLQIAENVENEANEFAEDNDFNGNGYDEFAEEQMCFDDIIEEVNDFTETFDDYVDVDNWNMTAYQPVFTQETPTEPPAKSAIHIMSQSASSAPRAFPVVPRGNEIAPSRSQATPSTSQATPRAPLTTPRAPLATPSAPLATPSASQTAPTANNSNVARFRQSLSTLPQSQNGFKPSKESRPANAAEVISKALVLRAEAIREKLKLDAFWKAEEMILNREKLELEREIRTKELELKKAEIESKERIRMAEIDAATRRCADDN